MISSIKGKIIDQGLGHLIIETAGIGYFVKVLPDTASKNLGVGAEILLWTYLAVREDSLELYGFETNNELAFFKNLISVSGIGPKTAMNILSRGNIDRIREAVGNADKDYLIKIAGINRKNTEKIILELQDKIAFDSEKTTHSQDGEILEALKALGYRENSVREILKNLPKDIESEKEKLKMALRELSNKK